MRQFEDYCFVVQGTVDLRSYKGSYVTLEVLESIRRIYPGAQLILSTWSNQVLDEVVKGLVDELVLSEDPGPIKSSDGILNINRQILNSLAGINAASRKFCIKLRSDTVVKNTNLVRAFEKKSVGKVLVTNLTSVNPRKRKRFLAVCDWVYVGETEVIRNIFDIPFYPQELTNHRINNSSPFLNAEQWITLNFLEKMVDADVMELILKDEITIENHESLVSEYFRVISFHKLGLSSTKYNLFYFGLSAMYTQKESDLRLENVRQGMRIDAELFVYRLAEIPLLRKLVKLFRW